MESNDHNLPEIAGPVMFAIFILALIVLVIWMMN